MFKSFSFRTQSKKENDQTQNERKKSNKSSGYSNNNNGNNNDGNDDDDDDANYMDRKSSRNNRKKRENREMIENWEEYEGEYNEEITSADILPTEKEKTNILSFFSEMRRESSFCDIAFTCQGTLFRAHKVIVSSWSRWLRSLLLEGTDDEVLSLDIFEPNALRSVLDYMYGVPLHIDIETADDLLKVIRRLELQELEQLCWRFLISVMNETNCNELHDLADRYDCPPLKLAAFRMLQEIDPSYSISPMNWDVSRLKENYNEAIKGRSGLTGPGEKSFYFMSEGYEDYEDEEDNRMLSVFDFARKYSQEGETDSDQDRDQDRDSEIDEDNNPEDRQESKPRVKPNRLAIFPDQLPPNATATEVIRAWSSRLQYVYEQCLPTNREFNEYENENDGDDDDREDKEDRYRDQILPNPIPSTIRFNYSKAPIRQYPLSRIGLDPVGIDSKRKGISGLDWRSELKRFYLAIKMPEKLGLIDEILKTWEGKEDQMIGAMIVKYKKLIPKLLLEHLDNLQTILETQTESSFVHVNAAAASYRNTGSKKGPKQLSL